MLYRHRASYLNDHCRAAGSLPKPARVYRTITLEAAAADTKAAVAAEIHDYIIHHLEKGYQTIIGENGVSLSGGQRQRIGIARALYKHPELLVFDEATNALDAPTEEKIFENISKMGYTKTMLVITHRVSILAHFDQVIQFENGRILSDLQH